MVKPVRRAVVVGGGFIGLETAENLIHIGFDVTLIQKPDHVLTPLDPEIAVLVQEHIIRHGVKVAANDGWSVSSSWTAAQSRSRRVPARLIRRIS